MCCGGTTHLCHMTQKQQNQKCVPMSHPFWEFKNKPILLHHDNVIMSSFPTKIHKGHRKFSWKQARTSKPYPYSTMCNRIDMLSCCRQMWKIYWVLICRWQNDQSAWCIQIGRQWIISYSSGIFWWKYWHLHWKIAQSICMQQMNICFNDVDTFIEMMRYCYDNMADLRWMNANKIKFKKLDGGKWKVVSSTQIIVSRNDGDLFEDTYAISNSDYIYNGDNLVFYLLIVKSLFVIFPKVNFTIYSKSIIMSLFALTKDTAKGWVSFNALVGSTFGKLLKCVLN